MVCVLQAASAQGLSVAGNQAVTVLSGGNVGIDTTTPGQKLAVSGNVVADAYYYSSDARLKKEVTTISSALDKVNALRGVNFTWIKNNVKTQGLIAQEVEGVLPDLVHTGSDGYKSVQYGNIVAILIEAIKEQQQEIEALKAKQH